MTRLLLVSMLFAPAAFAQTSSPVEVVLEEARAEGLPTTSLEAKAREGEAKGVPEDRVAGVLRSTLNSWRDAAAILGPAADGPEREAVVPAAAAALRHGADDDMVRSLAADPNAAAALQSMADVLYAGLAPGQAHQVVVAALDTPDPGSSLAELPRATRLMLATRSPEAAVSGITAALTSGSTPLAAVPEDLGGPPAHSSGQGKAKGRDK